MSNQITIHESSIPVVEYQGKRVVTFAMIDEVHQRPNGTARRNFNDNKSRFIENEDYFPLTQQQVFSMDEIRTSANPKGLTVVSESGYLMLTKSFTDDLAWKVQRELVNNYFKPIAKEQTQTQAFQLPQTLSEALLLAGKLAAENEQLEAQNALALAQIESDKQEIAILEPQAEALKRIAVFAEGTYCIRDSAKLLQVEEKFLKAYLSEHDWTYRRPTGGGLLGYSDKLKKGYLEHKLTTGDKTDGSGGTWSSNQVRITSKGLAKLSLLLNKGEGA